MFTYVPCNTVHIILGSNRSSKGHEENCKFKGVVKALISFPFMGCVPLLLPFCKSIIAAKKKHTDVHSLSITEFEDFPNPLAHNKDQSGAPYSCYELTSSHTFLIGLAVSFLPSCDMSKMTCSFSISVTENPCNLNSKELCTWSFWWEKRIGRAGGEGGGGRRGGEIPAKILLLLCFQLCL